MYCETVQEVLDTTMMAFKIAAEHHDVMLPVFRLPRRQLPSYGASRVEMPAQAEVDAFMGDKGRQLARRPRPLRPMAVDPLTGGSGGNGPSTFVRYRSAVRRHAERPAVIDRDARGMGAAASAEAHRLRRWSRNTGSTTPTYAIMTLGRHDRRRQGCGRRCRPMPARWA